MEIKDLNKNQLILLALLVSFITSIATGIVTVTLMDQAPPGVTQTINRVIEKTVEIVTPEGEKTTKVVTETVVIKEEDSIIDAVSKNEENVAKIGFLSSGQSGFLRGLGGQGQKEMVFEQIGSGLIVSSDGLVVTDSGLVQDGGDYLLKTHKGRMFDLDLLLQDEEKHIALLKITGVVPPSDDIGTGTPQGDGNENGDVTPGQDTKKIVFPPIVFSNSDKIKVGQTAIILGGTNGTSLLLGVVSRLGVVKVTNEETGDKRDVLSEVYTTTSLDNSYLGGPVIDTDAKVFGINVSTVEGGQFAIPSNMVKEVVATYTAKELDGITDEGVVEKEG